MPVLPVRRRRRRWDLQRRRADARHTTVSDNRADAASGLTSGAIGGGILNRAFGTLTLKHSVVTGNHAAVTPPNGRFADGGGITMVGGTLTITDSRVSDNSADASSAVPNGVEQNAVAGGIHVQENASATIRRTTITGNSISSTNTVGDANAFSGGLHADGPIVLRDSTISDNTRHGDGGHRLRRNADSGAGEINADATISQHALHRQPRRRDVPGRQTHTPAPVPIVTAAFDADDDQRQHHQRQPRDRDDDHGILDPRGRRHRERRRADAAQHQRERQHAERPAAPAATPEAAASGSGSAPDGPPLTQLTLVDSEVTHNTLTASPGITRAGRRPLHPIPADADEQRHRAQRAGPVLRMLT